jgi:hypothetical protein
MERPVAGGDCVATSGLAMSAKLPLERSPDCGLPDDVGTERLQAAIQQTATKPARWQRYWSWGMGLVE